MLDEIRSVPARYALRDHVFITIDEEHVVVLDLRRDRYFALPASRTARLADIVPGWPVRGSTNDASDGGINAAESLCRRGFLTKSPLEGKDATPIQVRAPTSEALANGGEEQRQRSSIQPRTLVAFLIASLIARLSLRILSFERVVRRAQRRRGTRAQAVAVTPHRAQELVDVYRRLRIYLFAVRNECLYDSLCLFEFLALHGVLADWVFGVRARPFAAHCWIQCGDMVLNDTVEHVASYKPIMSVTGVLCTDTSH
jgi:hypothetical protein